MIVTEIEPYTRTKFKVYLDGKFAFVLYKGELSRYGIRKEGEISAGIVEKIEDRSGPEESEAARNASSG